MIKEQLVFGTARPLLLGDAATPKYVKDWFFLCKNKDPVKTAEWAEIFAKVLADEADAMLAMGVKHV